MQHEPGTMGRLGVVESRQSLTRIATKKQWTGKIRIATLQIILHRKIDVHVDFFLYSIFFYLAWTARSTQFNI